MIKDLSKPECMGKEKSLANISSNSLDRVSKQIFIVAKILSKKQKKKSKKRTPDVILDPKGIIKITGQSIPENAVHFFDPILEWIDEYICNPADMTYIDINLDYINGFSSKFLLTILRKISYVQLKGKKFKINWYYKDDDEDMCEKGTYFSSVSDIPINFIKIV